MYSIKGRIWIEHNNKPFIGFGRMRLLALIKKHGSITEAAKAMNMSYRHAWEMVEAMNSSASKPLVERVSGGVGGGGTKVTEEGEKLIDGYRNLHRKFQSFNEAVLNELEL